MARQQIYKTSIRFFLNLRRSSLTPLYSRGLIGLRERVGEYTTPDNSDLEPADTLTTKPSGIRLKIRVSVP